MPYNAPDNSNLILPLAPPHMHGYNNFHSYPGYGQHAHPPPPFKTDMHDSHPNHSLMNQNHMMGTSQLPSVNPVQVNSSATTLSPISSLNNGNNGNEYHMQHHMSSQQQHHHSTSYHNSPPMEHSQPAQEVPNTYSGSPPTSMPSPPASIPPSPSNLKFEVVLEAPTAAAQRIDETTMTYLNKGQYYGVAIQDVDKYEGEFTSIVKVMFHDDAHRKMSSTYWSFWLTQQASPKTARALDIDKAASTGVKNVETKTFDRIQFQWTGKKGAKIFIRFNCLSTDFSRIKGVKGIPLRIHVETKGENGQTLEKSFAKVKLFRDKGAERKNKDDQKHLEKMCEKMRGKTQETTPVMMMYANPQSVTFFNDATGCNDASDDEEILSLAESLNNLDPEVEGGDIMNVHLGKRRRFSLGPDFLEPLDCDPTYIPIRKKRAVLCVYVKLPNEAAYRAIYLNHLTIQDLISKLADKLEIQAQSISNVMRYTSKRNITIRLDDESVQQIDDEQDMEVDYQVVQDGTIHLRLTY